MRLTDPNWINDPANRELAVELLYRAKHPFYQFCPYNTRRTGKPSWQWEMLAAAGDYKGRIVLAGNRTGKTELAIYELMLAIIGKHPTRKFPKSGIAWVIGLDYTMATKIDLRLFDKFLPPHIARHSEFRKDTLTWTVRRPDGGVWEVDFKSSEAGREKFQGAQIDIAVFDEEPKKTAVFNETKARLVDRAGVWWMAATPINGTLWLKELSESEGVFTCSGTMWDNPYLPEEDVRAFAASLTEEERQVRVEGTYIVFGGKPIFNTSQLTALLDRIRSEPSPSVGRLIQHAA